MPRRLWFEQPNENTVLWDIPKVEINGRIDRREFEKPEPPAGWKLVPQARADQIQPRVIRQNPAVSRSFAGGKPAGVAAWAGPWLSSFMRSATWAAGRIANPGQRERLMLCPKIQPPRNSRRRAGLIPVESNPGRARRGGKFETCPSGLFPGRIGQVGPPLGKMRARLVTILLLCGATSMGGVVMRTLCKVTLTLGVVALLAAPALAQRQRPAGRSWRLRRRRCDGIAR